MAAVTGMSSLLFEGVILLDKTEKKGLPIGDTHAAKVRFPTSFSKFFPFTYSSLNTVSIREIYFVIFFWDNLQDAFFESY